MSVGKRDEVVLERLPRRIGAESGERLQGRPVPGAEELDELLRRAEPEREVALGHLE